MTQEQRPRTAHRVIAERVKQLRNDHGWSAQRLGEELTRIGVAWDRSIVANFESGRRPFVTVEELFALAYVLGVTPVDLLVPDDAADDMPYQVAPEATASTAAVRDWIAGGFLKTPETPAELAEAVRWMPKARAGKVMREWFTPERYAKQARAANEFDDQTNQAAQQKGGEA